MKPKSSLLRAFPALLAFSISAASLSAADLYWDASESQAWGTAGNWSSDEAGTLPGTVPASGDTVYFNADLLTGGQTVNLGALRTVTGMVFRNGSGPTTIHSGSTSGPNTIVIGAGGITLDPGSGDVTFGTGANAGGVPVRLNSPTVTWENNSTGLLSILNTLASNNADPVTLTVTGSGNTTIANTVGNTNGALTLTKEGTGTLTLSHTGSSYTGATTISGGTLAVTVIANGGSNSSIGSSSADSGNLVFNGGTLDYIGTANRTTNRGFTLDAGGGTIRNDTTASVTFTGVVTGAGDFTKTGSGSLILNTAANDYTGRTFVNEGTLTARVASSLGASGSTANGTEIGPAGTLTFAPTAATTFTEHITLKGGTLSSTGSTSTVSAPVSLEANSTFSGTSTLAISGVISESGGSHGFTKTGTNNLSLTNSANSFTGPITISSGTVTVSSISNGGVSSALGAASSDPSNLILDGGTLAFGGNDGMNRGFTLADGKNSTISSTNQVFRIDGLATGSGNLIKAGNGTLALTNTANNYTGTTTINSGIVSIRRGTSGENSTLGTSTGESDGTIVNANATLQIDPAGSNGLGGSGTISIAEHITLNGGTLRSQSRDNTVTGPLVLTANSTLSAANGATLRVASAISGDGFGYSKALPGTVAIESTANTYTGTTAVSDGTLLVTGNINSSTALNINGTGIFSAGASNIVGDTATLTLGGGILQMNGFSDAMGVLAVTGSAELALGGGDSVISFADSSSQTWTTAALSVTGWTGLAEGGGSERILFDAAGLTSQQLASVVFVDPAGLDPGTYSAKFVGNELVPDILIPEPSVVWLAAAGLTAAGLRRRRTL